MKKFIDLTKFFIKTSSTYINWRPIRGNMLRLLLHALFYPIAYIRFIFYSYKHEDK